MAGTPVQAYLAPATTSVTATGTTGAAVTLTIPSAGAGLFNYLCLVEIGLYVATSYTGAATPVAVTTTGITNTPTFSIAGPTTTNVGQLLDRIIWAPYVPLKGSAAATAMTFVAPIVTNAIWRLNAHYYVDI